MKIWKALGLAGLAGVAATGAIIARDQRKRTHLEPADIRARLQARLAEATAEGQVNDSQGRDAETSCG
jgi:hypothetical protein